jgi:Tfp pilus assembly protein PilX
MIKKIKNQKSKIKNIEGAATLPTVMALTILIAALSAGLAAMTVAEGIISQGSWQSSRALFYAEAGAKDALMRIARDKKYTCATPSSGCYQIDFTTNGCSNNEGCAKITVSAATSPKVIISEGRVKGNVRKTQVSVTFDGSANGQIQSVSWQEIIN